MSFSREITCVQSDKPKLIALEESRNAYIQALSGGRVGPQQKLELGRQYLEQLASYEALQRTIADAAKGDAQLLTKLKASVYVDKPLFTQRSLFNNKPATFEEASLERYFTLFQLISFQIDRQLSVGASDVSVDVLKQNNQGLKEALGILDEVKVQARRVSIFNADVRDTALELRLETAENLERVVGGFFYINALECGILMNKDAERHDQAPAYDALVLAGFARAAESSFSQAEQQLSTAFKQDKALNKNYISFIKSMTLLSRTFKHWLYYKHFYDISVDVDAKDVEVENANTQKSLQASAVAKTLSAFEAVKISASAVSDWFALRFERYGFEFKKVADKARNIAGVPFDGASLVQAKPIPFSLPQPLWTTLNIPKFNQLCQEIAKAKEAEENKSQDQNAEKTAQNENKSNIDENKPKQEENKQQEQQQPQNINSNGSDNNNNNNNNDNPNGQKLNNQDQSSNIQEVNNQKQEKVENLTPKQNNDEKQQNYPNLPESDSKPPENIFSNAKTPDHQPENNIISPPVLPADDDIKQMPVMPSFGDDTPLLPKPL